MMTTWRKLFTHDRDDRNAPDQSPIVAVAPDESVLDVEFDNDFGGSEGPYFLIWTEQRVYFPVVYDGAEWIGSAPRNPQPEGQRHVGGE
jgi:hypothetical protein